MSYLFILCKAFKLIMTIEGSQWRELLQSLHQLIQGQHPQVEGRINLRQTTPQKSQITAQQVCLVRLKLVRFHQDIPHLLLG